VREPNTGAAVSVFNVISNPTHNHKVKIEEGMLSVECADIMRSFFRSKRKTK